ncbi:MAG TPA: GAF domain-containing protein [Verrucomicrobiae bacterium]|nr:GAF domain-containing protein [Verrucomicrobiae bacterium]
MNKSLDHLLNSTLETAIELTQADKGNIQFFDESKNELRIVAQSGFTPQFVEHFRIVRPGYCACGLALKRRERVLVKDIAKHPELSHLAPIFLSYGFTAVQSTPLFGAGGELFGVLSTHFEKPHAFPHPNLEMLDKYIVHAARQIFELN